MEIQSSYIFLKNTFNPDSEIKKKDEEGKYVVDFGNTVAGFIHQCYPKIERLNTSDNLFKTIYSTNIEKEKYLFEVFFKIYRVVNTIYLDICVKGSSRNQMIVCLEEIQEKLLHSGIRRYYIDIISYDAISEHYCNKIYGHLNMLERNLRKLFFNIFVLNFGKDFCSDAIEESLMNSLKSVINQDTKKLKKQYKKEYGYESNSEYETIIAIQRLFYSFDYNDMKTFLFTQTWNDYDKKMALAAHNDLSVLSDKELRELINSICPRTNWDRFFSEKVVLDDIETIFENIRLYRNTVAHFKFFNENNYATCLVEIRKLNKAILKAIKVTEEEDFERKNREHVKVVLAPVIEKVMDVLHNFKQRVAESATRFLRSDEFSNIKNVTQVLGEMAIEYSGEVDCEELEE